VLVPTIGIDVGGTKVLGVVLGTDDTVLAHERVASDPSGGGVEPAMATVVAALRAAVPEVGAIGVGIAGLVDDDGTLRYGPNLPDVLELPVRARLAAATGLPVHVDNDANAAGWAEVVLGAAAGARDALVVTLGTGIGGAIVIDGRVQRGAAGFAAEIGHFTVDRSGPLCACGQRGHWEAIASGSALGRLAVEAVARGDAPGIAAHAGSDAVSAHHLVAAARSGDEAALGLLARFADDVALGLAALANILDPAVIVVAGGLVEIGDLLLDTVRECFVVHLEGVGHRPEIPVVAARLGERAGAIGAALQARGVLVAR
jgi:glucokinase